MSTLHLSVTYRPLRIGFCVQAGNHDDLRRALRSTHCFWGGVFNPIIPYDGDRTDTRLISLFGVDALYAASDDIETIEFAKSAPDLPWPLPGPSALFFDSTAGREPQLLDMTQVVLKLEEYRLKNWLQPEFRPTLVEWQPSDTLADVLLATFGGFPDLKDVGRDYARLIETRLAGDKLQISASDPLPTLLLSRATPSSILQWQLRAQVFDWHRRPGLFVGGASSFEDLVAFWNLRASGCLLLFLDLAERDRLGPLALEHLQSIREGRGPSTGPPAIPIWSHAELNHADFSRDFGPDLLFTTISDATWNGLNVKPCSMTFDPNFTIASRDKSRGPVVTVSLPPKPFLDRPEFYHQHVAVSLSSITTGLDDEGATITPPFLPYLNEYYGRELYFEWNKVRSAPGSSGVIKRVTDTYLQLTALKYEAVIAKILQACGFKAQLSQPGRIARRLIQQMGGLQGCRVFKIHGVRELIRRYHSGKSFRRGEAQKLIGNYDEESQHVDFSAYEGLHLRHQKGHRLTPLDAFRELATSRVVRAGLQLKCPRCELKDWVSLDSLANEVACAFCGVSFDVTDQLRDRDWFYRTSGLFGDRGSKHQEGSIPVSLVLQSLHLNFRDRLICWSTSMDLTELGCGDKFCETDFVVVLRQTHSARDAVIVGECKAGEEIAEEDAGKLATVADRLAEVGVDPFVLFAKTSAFSSEEIERCKLAQAPWTERVIVLTVEDLEPLWFAERRDKIPENLRHVHDARDLAERTTALVFGGARLTSDGWRT